MRKKLLSVFTAAMLVFQAGIPAVFADTEEPDDLAYAACGRLEQAADSSTAAADEEEIQPEAGVSEERTAPDVYHEAYTAGIISGSEITYGIEDFVNNEVVVLYTDGSVEVKSYDSEDELEAALRALDEDESVDLFQPNIRYESDSTYADAAAVNDTYYAKQWALNNDGTFKGSSSKLTAVKGVDINAGQAWEAYEPKRDAVIAVIDTGIDYNNSEIADAMWINGGEIAGNGVDDDGNGYTDDVYGWNFYNNNNKIYTGSDDSHGTHCAGTIAAAKNNGSGIAGIADYDNIRIMSLKALGGAGGTGTTMSVLMAIKYAEDNGASICNLSLGTSDNDMLLYRIMANSDMLFVVAAGNSSNGSGTGTDTDKSPSYPASYDLENIISVANITAAGSLHKSSDYGAESVDIAAPGTDIISTGSDGKFVYMTGTSMAAPMVTAVSALVYTNSESLTLKETRDIILNNVFRMDSLTGRVSTGGMLDAGAAVEAAAVYESDGSSFSIPSEDDTADTVPQTPDSGDFNTPDGRNGSGVGFSPISGPKDYFGGDLMRVISGFPDGMYNWPQFTYINFPSYFGGRLQFVISSMQIGMYCLQMNKG